MPVQRFMRCTSSNLTRSFFQKVISLALVGHLPIISQDVQSFAGRSGNSPPKTLVKLVHFYMVAPEVH